MKNFNDIRNQVHDASGISNPYEWLWVISDSPARVWYPKVKIMAVGSYQKDIAIATAYFSSLLVATESFFNSIDKAYELANEFVTVYPPSTKWGVEENLEYEETLEKFFNEKK